MERPKGATRAIFFEKVFIVMQVLKKMRVSWNQSQEGFQDSWVWQFGEGPFEVVKIYDVPEGKRSYAASSVLARESEIEFEKGKWYSISVPRAAEQYRLEYGVEKVLFHQKWFNESS